MQYSTMIARIMQDVQNGSSGPIMVYRDNGGEWQHSHTQNQYGETFDWVKDIKDPCAVTFTDVDFARGSQPYVYDRILNERLRAECKRYFLPEADGYEMDALMSFLEENIGEFSIDVTDYLTMFDRPLAMLYDMTPISLQNIDGNSDYNKDKIQDYVWAVEDYVSERLNNRRKQAVAAAEHDNTRTEEPAQAKGQKYSVLGDLGDKKGEVVKADAARAGQGDKTLKKDTAIE